MAVELEDKQLPLQKIQFQQITAIDMLPQFLEKLTKKAEENNLKDRITVKEMSMDRLTFEEESFDVIWSEGAIYNIGFENGPVFVEKILEKQRVYSCFGDFMAN